MSAAAYARQLRVRRRSAVTCWQTGPHYFPLCSKFQVSLIGQNRPVIVWPTGSEFSDRGRLWQACRHGCRRGAAQWVAASRVISSIAGMISKVGIEQAGQQGVQGGPKDQTSEWYSMPGCPFCLTTCQAGGRSLPVAGALTAVGWARTSL